MSGAAGPFGADVVQLASVDSTMDAARAWAAQGAPHGSTVVALQQTGGRGRHSRHWVSAPGAGLWCTTLLCPSAHQDLSGLTLCMGGAVLRAVEALGCSAARIKWPNDLVVGERKLAGLLTEQLPDRAGRRQVLVGVGLNLAPEAPAALEAADAAAAARYVGLCGLCPEITLEQAQKAVLHALEAAYDAWCAHGMAPTLALFARAHALQGVQVRAHNPAGRDTLGVVTGIAANGGLELLGADGPVTLYAGEVTRVRAADDDSLP